LALNEQQYVCSRTTLVAITSILISITCVYKGCI